jgi:hypothetical protein
MVQMSLLAQIMQIPPYLLFLAISASPSAGHAFGPR